MRFSAIASLLSLVIACASTRSSPDENLDLLDGGAARLRGGDTQGLKQGIKSLPKKIRHRMLVTPGSQKHLKSSAHASSPQNRFLDGDLEGTLPTGLWSSRGYGYALNVLNETTAILMHETSISCILVDAEFAPSSSGLDAHRDPQDESTLIIQNGVTNVVFDRVNAFSGFCDQGLTPTIFTAPNSYVQNPLVDFDILVQTFVEHYAFFALRGQPNWTELTDAARINLTSASTDDDLILALASVLEPLRDGHVYVSANGIEVVTSDVMSIQAILNAEFDNQITVVHPYDYFVLQLTAWWEIVATHMVDGLNGDAGTLLFGILSDSPRTGYLQLMNFDPEDDAAFSDLLSVAMQYLREKTDSLVLDIRINFGGSDEVALFVASYFAMERTLAFSKRARWGDGFTEQQSIYLDPLGDDSQRYAGPVVLLTSQSTVSAAEIFTMTMKELPQVVQFGEPTLGILSDILEHKMPNGMSFGLSNEQYASADGTIHEGIGFTPDIGATASLLPLEERQGGVDSWLTEAVAIAEELAAQLVLPTNSPTDFATNTLANESSAPTPPPSGSAATSIAATAVMVMIGSAAAHLFA